MSVGIGLFAAQGNVDLETTEVCISMGNRHCPKISFPSPGTQTFAHYWLNDINNNALT
jgi:hypothetical protein